MIADGTSATMTKNSPIEKCRGIEMAICGKIVEKMQKM